MKTIETLNVNFWLEKSEKLGIEIGIGKKENSKYARKYLCGECNFEINYVGDKWETLPEFTISNLKFIDENENEINLRPANFNRITELIENELNDLDCDTMERFGVDPEKCVYYDETPIIYTL